MLNQSDCMELFHSLQPDWLDDVKKKQKKRIVTMQQRTKQLPAFNAMFHISFKNLVIAAETGLPSALQKSVLNAA